MHLLFLCFFINLSLLATGTSYDRLTFPGTPALSISSAQNSDGDSGSDFEDDETTSYSEGYSDSEDEEKTKETLAKSFINIRGRLSNARQISGTVIVEAIIPSHAVFFARNLHRRALRTRLQNVRRRLTFDEEDTHPLSFTSPSLIAPSA